VPDVPGVLQVISLMMLHRCGIILFAPATWIRPLVWPERERGL